MSKIDMVSLNARVARFKDTTSSPEAFVDTSIPEFQYEIYNIIGRGVTEDARLEPMIADNRDFNLTMMKADPGKATRSLAINAWAKALGLYVNEDGELVDRSAQTDRGDG